jgi:hypothetical protein
MRTLLIAPSFLTVFVGAIIALGLLITNGSSFSPNAGMMPARDAYTSWHETMPTRQKVVDPSRAAVRESVDELEYY